MTVEQVSCQSRGEKQLLRSLNSIVTNDDITEEWALDIDADGSYCDAVWQHYKCSCRLLASR